MSHAVFVWASYAVALVGLGGLALASFAARRRARRDVEARGLDRKAARGAGVQS